MTNIFRGVNISRSLMKAGISMPLQAVGILLNFGQGSIPAQNSAELKLPDFYCKRRALTDMQVCHELCYALKYYGIFIADNSLAELQAITVPSDIG